MDKKTISEQLGKLVADCGFRRYHEEQAKGQEFNVFDVLRYADYEIRHSNVLAWLLDPTSTHGIGRAFLDWFLNEVNVTVADRSGLRVRVERELYRVDVTVFLESDQDQRIVAIENKTGGYSPKHVYQVLRLGEVLRRQYPDYNRPHNVLLTSSREVPDLGPRITHVSWSDIRTEIERMHNKGAFKGDEVAAFVGQYIAAIGRLLGRDGNDDHYFRNLLTEHHSLLRHMFEVLVNDGEDKVRAMVPDHHAPYRETAARLVKDFGQEPKRLRGEVRGMLESRGMATQISTSRDKKVFWLSWDLEDAEALGIGGCISWVLEFRYRSIRASLEVARDRGQWVDHILAFMRKTPVDRRHRTRYPRRDMTSGGLEIYSHQLVDDDSLSGRSTAEVTKTVLREVANFLDSQDADYKRIRDYFKCLAFPHGGAVAPADEASS